MSTIEVDITDAHPAFQLDVQFKSPGGVTAIFGPSGSGKTSVVNAIAGLSHPQSGRIVVNDRVLLDTAEGVFIPPHERRIGYVFQEPRLFPHMTVRDNVGYGGQRAAISNVIDILGIEHLLDRRPAGLSGGEAQRVAIARALLSNPDIVVMDEPLSALDHARKDEFLPYLEWLRDNAGVPIFYVSHAMSEVARLANDLVVLRDGKVVRSGPLAEMLSDPAAVKDLGIREAGALLVGRILRQKAGDGLSEVETSAGRLFLPEVSQPDGADLRVRIVASDVILSRDRPDGLSALNILPCIVTQIQEGTGPGVAVGLRSGEDLLVARITQRSARAMKLSSGTSVFAVIKSVSVAPQNVGTLAIPLTSSD